MPDVADDQWEEFLSEEYGYYCGETRNAFRWYFWCNIVLSVCLIAASTTTSVFVSNKDITTKYIHPVAVAIVSWIATATSLIISSFAIKENKDKNQKLRDYLVAESAYLKARTGPYAMTNEPRKLFVSRVTELYLGANPSTPAHLGAASPEKPIAPPAGSAEVD